MADGVSNTGKGTCAEKFNDAAANGRVILLQANEAESTLIDRDTESALLAEAGNTEATFTNYAPKTGISGTVTIDDTNDRTDVDIPDQTWTSAGNGTNNTLTKLIVLYADGTTTTSYIPMTHHDFTPTTDGSDLTAEFNAAGFYRAS